MPWYKFSKKYLSAYRGALSFSSVIPISRVAVVTRPPPSVTITVTYFVSCISLSNKAPAFTVTSPLAASRISKLDRKRG